MKLEDFENFEIDAESPSNLSIPSGPQPRTYLSFANQDLNEPDSDRSRINSVSNAKRALHLQTDIISEGLGFHLLSKNGRKSSFPTKLNFCASCSIISPRILTKLNRLRNSVEHDYYIPMRGEAEDFADIVELFLGATDFVLKQFPSDIDLSAPDDFSELGLTTNSLHIEMEPSSGIINVDAWKLTNSTDEIRSLVAAETVVIKANGKCNESSNKTDKSPEEEIIRVAYSQALKRIREEGKVETMNKSISIADLQEFQSWVTFIFRKARGM